MEPPDSKRVVTHSLCKERKERGKRVQLEGVHPRRDRKSAEGKEKKGVGRAPWRKEVRKVMNSKGLNTICEVREEAPGDEQRTGEGTAGLGGVWFGRSRLMIIEGYSPRQGIVLGLEVIEGRGDRDGERKSENGK